VERTIRRTALVNFLANPDYNVQNALILTNERIVKENKGKWYLPVYYVMFLDFDKMDDIFF